MWFDTVYLTLPPKAKKAGVIVGVTVAIGVLIALVHVTTLSLLSGVDISIVSALIIGGIYYEVAYGVSEYSLSSELSVQLSGVRNDR